MAVKILYFSFQLDFYNSNSSAILIILGGILPQHVKNNMKATKFHNSKT